MVTFSIKVPWGAPELHKLNIKQLKRKWQTRKKWKKKKKEKRDKKNCLTYPQFPTKSLKKKCLLRSWRCSPRHSPSRLWFPNREPDSRTFWTCFRFGKVDYWGGWRVRFVLAIRKRCWRRNSWSCWREGEWRRKELGWPNEEAGGKLIINRLKKKKKKERKGLTVVQRLASTGHDPS